MVIDRLATSGRTNDCKLPVFIYSGFRASSTWLWSKFRAHDGVLCYYEPFNEQLGSLTLDNIEDARPENWRSHHPSGDPYVLEYARLLGKGPGVSGFPATHNLSERFLGVAGPEGSLDDDIAAYVQGLINNAHASNQTPLLACTRMLGRAFGLKSAFGGYHILLIRNLFHQWNSYAGQARFGNWYFLHTLYETLGLAKRDPVIADLARVFPEETCSSLEAWVAPDNFDRVFCYFAGFHLYFLTLARRSADLVIDANALAGPNPDYRDEIVARIARDIGIELDLGDAHEQVDFPLYPVADRPACVALIDEIANIIASLCDASADEKVFIEGLVADIWSEQAIFQRQTAGAVEYLAQIDVRLRDAQQEATRQAKEAIAVREESALALDAVRQELVQKKDEVRRALVDIQARLTEREVALRAAQTDLVHEREVAMLRSTALAQEMEQREGELVATNEKLVATCEILSRTREALELAQGAWEVERTQNTRRETKMAAEAEAVQIALIDAQADSERLRAWIDKLERNIANVDATNANLIGQLFHAERTRDQLEKYLVSEQGARKQMSDAHRARHRLYTLLNLLIARRLSWALLPEPLWRRKLGEGLAALPDFEGAFEGVDRDPTLDRLAEYIWAALVRGS